MKKLKLKKQKAFTFAETKNRHSEARSAEESIMKSDSSLPLRMTGRKAAFTLAETLIVLVILGVIASITIPPLVRRQIEAANRTKIKKAMRIYDLVMNKMTVENGIRDNTALKNFAGDENNNCAGSSSYFKQAEGTGCVFKTTDGVCWDISDITHISVALNCDDLDEADNLNSNKAFSFLSWFDNNGTLRIDDLATATGGDKDIIAKVYDYISAKTKMSKEEVSNSENSGSYNWGNNFINALANRCIQEPYKNCIAYDETEVNEYLNQYVNVKVYDANGNLLVEGYSIGFDSNGDLSYFNSGTVYYPNGTKMFEGAEGGASGIVNFDNNGNITSVYGGTLYSSDGTKKFEGDYGEARLDSNGNIRAISDGELYYPDGITKKVEGQNIGFDSNGNITNGTIVTLYNTNGTKKFEGDFASFDSNGNVTSSSVGRLYDTNGNLISECTHFICDYDSNGNITSFND